MLKLKNKPVVSGLIGIGLASFLFSIPVAMGAQPDIPIGAGISSWAENGTGGRYVLQIQSGTMPQMGQSTTGTVLSDSNCAPDEEGINHCSNEIKLSDGSLLTGIDNHKMSVNRCLRSGEAVTVSKLSEGWAMVLTQGAEATD